jgi:hypothetical protein
MDCPKHFLKGMTPIGGYLPIYHILNFLHGGDGFGVKGRIFCANGTFPLYSYISSVLGGFNGVHKRLLTPNYTLFWKEMQLFRLFAFLPGAPSMESQSS